MLALSTTTDRYCRAECAHFTHSDDCDSMLHVIVWGFFNRPVAVLLVFIYTLYAFFTLTMSIVQVSAGFVLVG